MECSFPGIQCDNKKKNSVHVYVLAKWGVCTIWNTESNMRNGAVVVL